jgi:dipeptidyl aminopeptidase/acylaminoacyl peptidase
MPDASATPFSSIDDYLAIPRAAGVVLSPDGTRLVCPVQTLSPDRTKYVTSLWDVDPRGERGARRLTWGAKGESSPAFTPDGDLLFVAKRSEVVRPPSDQPDAAEPPDDVATLWLLPAGGGEARELVAAASDISAVRVASAAGTVVVTAGVLPGPFDGDAARRKARKDAGVSALLHEASPVRQWDHDLGPDEPRLLAVEIPDGDGRAKLRDLTPDPGRGLDDAEVDVSADGSFLSVSWQTPQGRGLTGRDLVLIDVATGARRVLGASRRDVGGEPARHNTDPSI